MKRYAALGSPCDIGIVRNHYNCRPLSMKLFEKRHDLVAGGAIKGACRLIGQYKHGVVDEGASDGDALLLASGELTGPMMPSMIQADALQSLCGSAVSFASANPGINERQLDIFDRCRPAQEC